MSNWSLPQLFASLHEDVQQRLGTVRKTMGHPVNKGDANEGVWLELFKTYLPERYAAAKACVVDSKGAFSEQIDVVVFDRQYSPFIFNYEGVAIIPAESVYAVFEAKQSINAKQVKYAQDKIASVRKLYRTSLPIPHAGGTFPPKALIHIHGGILTFESDWSPKFGKPLTDALAKGKTTKQLDLGCVANCGYFAYDTKSSSYKLYPDGKSATSFLFKLIADLQFSGTVPMIDVQAYAEWINKS